ncbi:flagellar biosynthetic protein FliO [Sedimentibacter sp. zth1]|uniref:FliO/MopB family protein n=1 Tax=Sedimentibacter sp. zth1 TaxID=2816908 RepID=UPI001A924619|nr:flagellar biosynthetic protein FliO [Sedimentibacter sp. zth1]QSX07188.1 flagellar biosynthetic protein FliO [Sedimentibacter sp. zth1]
MIAIIGIILVLFLTYYCTKSLSKGILKYSTSKNIKIIDKVPLGQNKYLIIIDVCDKNYLVSVTDNNINILKELDDNIVKNTDSSKVNNASFCKILNEAIKNRKSSKFKKGIISDEIDKFGERTKKKM